jgi:hypothetical protein
VLCFTGPAGAKYTTHLNGKGGGAFQSILFGMLRYAKPEKKKKEAKNEEP